MNNYNLRKIFLIRLVKPFSLGDIIFDPLSVQMPIKFLFKSSSLPLKTEFMTMLYNSSPVADSPI